MVIEVGVGDLLIPTWPLSVLAFMIVAPLLYYRGISLSRLLFVLVFWIYITFAIDKVFFPMDISGDYADTMREYASLPPVNVIPLYFGPYAGFTSVFIQSVQNVILTIPFGFGLNFITKVTSRFFFLLAFLLGFGL
jgi:glycopeptide antibiotics resistance protein